MNRTFLIPLMALGLAACKDTENPEEVNENEVITTVVLTFTPSSGGAPLEFTWADPQSDGSPVIDDVVLSEAEDYDLAVSFLDELEEPAEDITEEVAAEGEEHQVFITGTAVEGPATGVNPDGVVTHAYADADANGDPVGLDNTISVVAVGQGSLTVTLRHLPPQGDTPVKTGDLAEQVATGGFEAIPGDTDAQVSFDLVVQ